MTGSQLVRFVPSVLAALWWATSACAQGASVPFGGLSHDNSLPVEISADSLAVDQAAGTAEFKGAVLAGQGELRISADTILVEYITEGDSVSGKIRQMIASGGVTLTNGGEAAEAQRAVYTVESGMVEMSGDVVLTQGDNAMSGQKLKIDLESGQALIEGRVRTIFRPEGN